VARIRSIHPDFPSDKKLATVCRDARLTYVSCWCIADDAGLFRADPRQLIGQLFPYDGDVTEAQLEGWLVALVDLGLVRWHQTKHGARVGQIVNWPKRQKIDKPSKSFLQAEITGLATLSRVSGETPASGAHDGIDSLPTPSRPESRVLSPEPRVLSPEPGGRLPPASELPGLDTLLEKLEEPHLDAVEGYIRAAQFPRDVVATILAEGPDTGTNAAAGKTWPVIGQALVEMRAAGKSFTPIVFRAFIRRLLEAPPARPGESPGDRARATADRLERQGAKK